MTEIASVGGVLLIPAGAASSSSMPLSATSRFLRLAFTYSFSLLFSSASLFLFFWWERILTPVDCDDPADEPWVDEAVDNDSFVLLVRIFSTNISRRVQLAVTNIIPVKTKTKALGFSYAMTMMGIPMKQTNIIHAIALKI
eukprot:CAMPEP_0178537192 /NCGR_PEP_ID=MMETSP0696-20121128/36469_1 /TAXON_ID=265572 /ORGANISM="Extubocellulus spinifer, Strain CCMP396" /LENGTH=140 /DNA_ID=CAMNT_0020169425 /DNA_START=151 /DNA_END=573 /DNA_ORIENTATION=-